MTVTPDPAARIPDEPTVDLDVFEAAGRALVATAGTNDERASSE